MKSPARWLGLAVVVLGAGLAFVYGCVSGLFGVTWGAPFGVTLPIGLATAAALVCGVISAVKNSLRPGIAGLLAVSAGVVYLLVLAVVWYLSWP